MALVTAAAAVAGTTAAAAYLDAKYHISQDVRLIAKMKIAERDYAKAVARKRESCFYIFEAAVHKYPDIISIWSANGCYTSKEVHENACRYAGFFTELGVKPGDLVAFFLQNQPEFIFAWLGLWAIGCAPAMINFNLAGDALIHCLKISGAKMVLVDGDVAVSGKIADERIRVEELGMRVTHLDNNLKRHIALQDPQRPEDSYREGVRGSFPAALFYTSGTTGLPKAAAFSTTRMHVGAIVFNRLGTFCGQIPGPGGDRWYDCMPFYHGTGGVTAVTMIMGGISLAIGKGFSARNFWKEVRDSEATVIVYVGETARYLLAASPSPLDRQHKVRCMYGNGLRPDVWLKFRERFGVEEVIEFFNSSEGMFGLRNWNRGDYTASCVGHHGALLRMITNRQYVPVEVDNETNELVRDPKTGFAKRNSYEQGGEIIVQIPGEAAFAGYWKNPSATKKKFAYDVFKKGDIFYRSGDALRRTPDGRWYFLDRLGDTYRWKSENVSTAEVAHTIGQFPDVLEANVYGVLVLHHDGRAGCAALSIAPEKRSTFDWEGFAKYASERLPRYAVPVFIRVMSGDVGSGAMHNNKQNKTALREEGVDPMKLGSKVSNGKEDAIWYMRPGSKTYVPFGEAEWESLVGHIAKL